MSGLSTRQMLSNFGLPGPIHPFTLLSSTFDSYWWNRVKIAWPDMDIGQQGHKKDGQLKQDKTVDMLLPGMQMLDGSFSDPADFADMSFSLFQSWAPEIFNSADQ